MNSPKSQFYFLLVLLVGALVLAFLMFKPFLYAIILAGIFSIIFQPIYKKINTFTKNRQSLASFLTVLLIIIFVFIPVVFLGTQIFHEAKQLYTDIVIKNEGINLSEIFDGFNNNLSGFLPGAQIISIDFNQYVSSGLQNLINNIGPIFSNFAKFLMNFFIFLLSLFFLLKDGNKLKKYLISLSPLPDFDDKIVFAKLKLSIESVVKGSLFISLAQATLTSIGLAIFSVPNPILFGAITAVTALIPSIGTGIVIIPAVLYLFFNHMILQSIGLLAWGIVVVGLVDSLIAPKIIGKGIKLNPFIILLSVLGGISFFGPIGFLLGPIIISLLVCFIEIYFSMKTKI
ncbi:MAG: AI-2E family transporter [Candidatus Paceibacterota bacterium]|jgi:predicted PurR-regulated permease PerM